MAVPPAPFVSPLLRAEPGALDWIDFGRPSPIPGIDALADRLNQEIMGLTAGLPAPLRGEADSVLSGYAGGRRFVDLFYRPVWSFLHWVPAPADPALLAHAIRVQAISLFLHLWDDHLSDGQLPLDLLRLHLRSLAWQSFWQEAEALRAAAGLPVNMVQDLVSAYLVTVHRPGQVKTLVEHAERMVAQVGIWRVTPLLYGHIVFGPEGATSLCRVVERFSVAWRLMDDVQDVAGDVATTQQNALALALDGPGQAAWAACAAKSAGQKGPDMPTWRAVCEGFDRGALAQVIAQIELELAEAQLAASTLNLPGLADELAACQPKRTANPTK
jgi:hypothetical protein